MKKFHQPDYLFFVCFGIILFIGAVFLVLVSSPLGARNFQDPFYFLKHQLIFGFIPGLILFFVLSRLDYHLYKRYAVFLLIITFLLLFLVFVPNLGYGRGLAQRWIKIGNISFQPAELAKLTFLFYLVAWLDKRDKEIKKMAKGTGLFILLLYLMTLPIILQRHLSTLIIIFLVSLTVFFLAGARLIQFLIIIGLILNLVLLMIILSPFHLVRLRGFLEPGLDPKGAGYHLQQALIAVGSGGLLGRGLGRSVQKFLYLPETFGDSIFAVMAEEFGLIGILIFLSLYGFFIYRGFRIARSAPDNFGYLLVAGIMAWIFFQAMINIGAMIGLLPLTGVPLPLISYGGSAMAILLAALGIVINVSRQTRESRPRLI